MRQVPFSETSSNKPSFLLPAHLQRIGRPWMQINLLQACHSRHKEILAFFRAEAVKRERSKADLDTGLSHALQDNDTAREHLFGSCFYYFDGFNTTLFHDCDLQDVTQALGMWILSVLHTQVANVKLARSGKQLWFFFLIIGIYFKDHVFSTTKSSIKQLSRSAYSIR